MINLNQSLVIPLKCFLGPTQNIAVFKNGAVGGVPYEVSLKSSHFQHF
jgi:hypothetical protein